MQVILYKGKGNTVHGKGLFTKPEAEKMCIQTGTWHELQMILWTKKNKEFCWYLTSAPKLVVVATIHQDNFAFLKFFFKEVAKFISCFNNSNYIDILYLYIDIHSESVDLFKCKLP